MVDTIHSPHNICGWSPCSGFMSGLLETQPICGLHCQWSRPEPQLNRDWGLSDEPHVSLYLLTGWYDTNKDKEHAGTVPLSELETRSIYAIVRRVASSDYLSVHSADSDVMKSRNGGDVNNLDMKSAPRNSALARNVTRANCGACETGHSV